MIVNHNLGLENSTHFLLSCWCLGWNLSVVGSILYTFLAFRSKATKPASLPTVEKDVINTSISKSAIDISLFCS